MIEHIHQTTGYSIRRICATLALPRSSYYHAAQPTSMQSSDQDIGVEIETIFKHHRCRYGYRRIKEQLSDHMRTELWLAPRSNKPSAAAKSHQI